MFLYTMLNATMCHDSCSGDMVKERRSFHSDPHQRSLHAAGWNPKENYGYGFPSDAGREGYHPDFGPAVRGSNAEFQHHTHNDPPPVDVGRPIQADRPYGGSPGRHWNQQMGRDDGYSIDSNRSRENAGRGPANNQDSQQFGNAPVAGRHDFQREEGRVQNKEFRTSQCHEPNENNRDREANHRENQRSSRHIGDDGIDMDRKQDTVIGKGFTAAMRRGVNQAPKRDSEAMVLEATEGGFVATLQRGFEGFTGGIFTSKEEVLKQRGPVPATEYDFVPGDDIDQKVQYFASRIPQHQAEELMLYRISKGEYEIDGARVRMEWQPRRTQCGRVQNQIIVISTGYASEQPPEPLHTYIQMCAAVKHQLEKNTVIGKLPECERVSFAMDGPQPSLRDCDGDDRYNAMQVAAEQARQREEHAREWAANNPLPRGGSKMGRPQDLAERAENPADAAEPPARGSHHRRAPSPGRSQTPSAHRAPNGSAPTAPAPSGIMPPASAMWEPNLSAHVGPPPSPAPRQFGPPSFSPAGLGQYMVLGGPAPPVHTQPGFLPTRHSSVMVCR